ncbi:hypothetical protein CHS0354_020405 [Potamilus streckersoni]|uniref:Carbohydrate sulfotransferase n=1 Tax=Potamilus streckersoni TaxID=2493646 RepID=A0AAE0TFL7_9BIVA|nr:hypothetical protein CHS0354_020405 [Potamilus streckersoni]
MSTMDMNVLMRTYTRKKRVLRFLIISTIVSLFAWLYLSYSGLPHLEIKTAGPRSSDSSMTTVTKRLINGMIEKDVLQRRMNHMRNICTTNVAKRYFLSIQSPLGKNIYTYTPLERFTSKDVCFCKVPKSGSTFWGRALYMISHPEQAEEIETYYGMEVHGELFYRKAKPCTDSMINNAHSFMVTRDPWSRLYSSYIDKVYLEKFGEFTAELLQIENRMSGREKDSNVSVENECQSRAVSFEIVLRYVVATSLSTKYELDPHFAPVALLCNPCRHHYAFFIKQERLNVETNFALDFLEVSGRLRSRLDMTDEGNYIEATVPNLVMTTITAFERNKRSCLTKNDIYQRIWNVLQIQGLVSEELDFPKEVFDNQESSVQIARALTDYVLQNRLETIAAGKQRTKFLEKAYAQVNQYVLRKVQGIFAMDFLLFEYGVNPPGFKKDDQIFIHTTASKDN